MNLTIDIGNTKTKVAVVDDYKVIRRFTWKRVTENRLEELLEDYVVDKAILSTVAGVPEILEQWFEKLPFAMVLDHHTPVPFVNTYKTPETLGRDRLAAVAGAFHLYPESNCLVIDAGTCITHDLILENGEYLGGAISPGIKLRFKAMNQFTASLPKVNRQRLETDIGYNTESSMRIGAQLGAVLEVQGFIDQYTDQFKTLTVLFTGGDTEYFVSQLKSKIFAHPNLVHIGLNKILEYNAHAHQ
ncbi:MAG: type III pantothenate kinase [Bacteroidota bacterium]